MRVHHRAKTAGRVRGRLCQDTGGTLTGLESLKGQGFCLHCPLARAQAGCTPLRGQQVHGGGAQGPLSLRQTQRSPEGPRHLHRIPRLSERRASLAPVASLSTFWLPVFLRPSLHEHGDSSLVSSSLLKIATLCYICISRALRPWQSHLTSLSFCV